MHRKRQCLLVFLPVPHIVISFRQHRKNQWWFRRCKCWIRFGFVPVCSRPAAVGWASCGKRNAWRTLLSSELEIMKNIAQIGCLVKQSNADSLSKNESRCFFKRPHQPLTIQRKYSIIKVVFFADSRRNRRMGMRTIIRNKRSHAVWQ